MARVDSLRRVPDEEWAALNPDLLDLLADGDPPAFATDSRERVVFWNRGAAGVFGLRSEEALGRHCFEVVCGRDVFGNRLCQQDCALLGMARAGEPISGFELRVPSPGGADASLLHVTVLRIPGPRPDLFTLVHVVQPIDQAARVAFARAPAPAFAPAAGPLAPPAEAPPLTPREMEVLQHVAAGLQNKEIAEKQGLSLATVRNHVHNSLEKLDVHSKLEMVALAFRRGWVRTAALPAVARG